MEPSRYCLAGLVLALTWGAPGNSLAAQTSVSPRLPASWTRPVPPPLPEPRWLTKGLTRGTRTRSGVPGPNYWTPSISYRLNAELDTAAKRLNGAAQILYINRSPDTLGSIYMHLAQNLFAPGGIRNQEVPITGGFELKEVTLNGRVIKLLTEDEEKGGYQLYSTAMRIAPTTPLLPGDTVSLGFRYSFIVPLGPPRSGRSTDGLEYVIAYWYPQIAVFDDLARWRSDLYRGTAEFYQELADFDVTLTVPDGWLVAGTGTLVDPGSILGDSVRGRLAKASESPSTILLPGERPTLPGASVWHLSAHDVRDFAWATSPRWRWDVQRVAQGTRSGPGPDIILASALYRPNDTAWVDAVGWTASALRDAGALLDRRYAYPQFTTIQGPGSCSGIEYPMATCIDPQDDPALLRRVMVHEVAHSWTPMRVASDENHFPWMDEGMARYVQNVLLERVPGGSHWAVERDQYLTAVKAGAEVETMRSGDLFPEGSEYGTAEYVKPAMALRALQGVLGDSVFLHALRTYILRWDGRHPSPYDFFWTFNDVTRQNLDWFWRTWFFETWPLDQAIGPVKRVGADLLVEIDDRGWAPMPVLLMITRSHGPVEHRILPVDEWLAGKRSMTVRLPDAASITKLELDPDGLYPDVDRTNQEWKAGGR